MAAPSSAPPSTTATSVSNVKSGLLNDTHAQIQGGTATGGEGDKAKSDAPPGGGNVKKKNFEFKADKMRVKLTPIEEYEKKLVFHLTDAPSRVVTRLERLMGSDKVCLMDHDWMRQLEDRLDAEDEKEWAKRNQKRIDGERLRWRQLAIDGLMPVPDTPDMQDIYKNPVYRVNKIINRLNRFDYNALINPKLKMPPLTLIDPFEYDPSGKSFKSWPGHNATIEELEKNRTKVVSETTLHHLQESASHDQIEENPDEAQSFVPPNAALVSNESQNEEAEEEQPSPDIDTEGELPEPPEVEVEKRDNDDEAEYDEEEDEEGEELEDIMQQIKDIDDASRDSMLAKLRQKYGIGEDVDLKVWEPFHSKLLELFDQLNTESEAAVTELYEVGDNVVGVYNREVLEAEEQCIHLAKVINAHANNLEIPVKPTNAPPEPSSSMQSTDVAESTESVVAAEGGPNPAGPSSGNDAK